MVPKHIVFASRNKWSLAPFIPKASFSSSAERNHARSAILTVFSPISHRQARETDGVGREKGDRLLFLQERENLHSWTEQQKK